jgi:hypothetical protein
MLDRSPPPAALRVASVRVPYPHSLRNRSDLLSAFAQNSVTSDRGENSAAEPH